LYCAIGVEEGGGVEMENWRWASFMVRVILFGCLFRVFVVGINISQVLEGEGAWWSLEEGATSDSLGAETYLGGAFVILSDLY
jgi:hypothetical protein